MDKSGIVWAYCCLFILFLVPSQEKKKSLSRLIEESILFQTHTLQTFDYDSYPTDFMIPYSVRYGAIPPILEINVTRPDGHEFRIYYSALPSNAVEKNREGN